MSINNTNSLKSVEQNHRLQDTKKEVFKAQMKRINNAFNERPKTMLEVSKETNVMRANICRYVGKWKKADEIGVSYLGVCPVTKRKGVQFLTTDSSLFLKTKTVK